MSTGAGRAALKRKERKSAMEDAGFGDTHNDLRSAASQLSGVWTVFLLFGPGVRFGSRPPRPCDG